MADANGRKRKRDGDAAVKAKKQATEMPSKFTISSISQAKLCPPVVGTYDRLPAIIHHSLTICSLFPWH